MPQAEQDAERFYDWFYSGAGEGIHPTPGEMNSRKHGAIEKDIELPNPKKAVRGFERAMKPKRK